MTGSAKASSRASEASAVLPQTRLAAAPQLGQSCSSRRPAHPEGSVSKANKGIFLAPMKKEGSGSGLWLI